MDAEVMSLALFDFGAMQWSQISAFTISHPFPSSLRYRGEEEIWQHRRRGTSFSFLLPLHLF
jgi:hypothetical protein